MKKQITYAVNHDCSNSEHLLSMIDNHLRKNCLIIKVDTFLGRSVTGIYDPVLNCRFGWIEQTPHEYDSHKPYVRTTVFVEPSSRLEEIMDDFL